jgi:hypothetical protein
MSVDSWSVSREILEALWGIRGCPARLPVLQEGRRMAPAIQIRRRTDRSTRGEYILCRCDSYHPRTYVKMRETPLVRRR